MRAGMEHRIIAADTRARRPWPLLALWLAVSVAGLWKAFHIDDAAHLLIAQWIAAHPLHPMQGMLNWDGIDEPIWRTNQPHLWFYAIAGWGTLFGWSEPAMHALTALATLAATLLMRRLGQAVAPRHADALAAVFLLNPAVAVGGNVMVDVPLVACWLAMFVCLCAWPGEGRQHARFGWAAAALSAALLIKYSSLCLLPVLWIALLWERRWRQMWAAAMPLAVLAAWSAFNWWDYGGVHLFGRATAGSGEGTLRFAVGWAMCLGAITPAGLMAAAALVSGRWRRALVAATALGFAGLYAEVAAGVVSDGWAERLLWAGFCGNGGMALAAALPAVWRVVRGPFWREPAPERAALGYLLLWLAGASVFYLLFTPFLAARHVLLVVPPVLLLAGWGLGERLGRGAKVFGLAAALIASLGTGIADAGFAGFWRQAVPEVGAGRRFVNGHWGLQWYAGRAGYAELDVRRADWRAGDWLLVGANVARHLPRHPPGRLERVLEVRQVRGPLDLFCTSQKARFYAAGTTFPPWTLARDCGERLRLYRVVTR